MIAIPLLLSLMAPKDRVMLFDMIEVNHVYDPATMNVRFDQLIFYDWSDQHKEYHVEAYHLMDKCRDFDDKEHKAEWQAAIEKWLEHWPELQRIEIRAKIKYPGTYVWNDQHPWKTADGRWTVRLVVNNRVVVVKSRRFTETYTTYDQESTDAAEVKPRHQRRNLNWREL